MIIYVEIGVGDAGGADWVIHLSEVKNSYPPVQKPIVPVELQEIVINVTFLVEIKIEFSLKSTEGSATVGILSGILLPFETTVILKAQVDVVSNSITPFTVEFALPKKIVYGGSPQARLKLPFVLPVNAGQSQQGA
ncbi:hypothetical protein ACSVDA_24280 [Cytobacillus sp. Hm23]